MLILSRRNGESFYIGEDIKITVLSQRSNQVRIGIDAPRALPVHREEVLERQKQQAQREREEQNEPTIAAEKAESGKPSASPASKKAETEEL